MKSTLGTLMVEEKRRMSEHQKRRVETDRLNEFMEFPSLYQDRWSNLSLIDLTWEYKGEIVRRTLF